MSNLNLSERVKREQNTYDSGSVYQESDRLQKRFWHVFNSPNVLRAQQAHQERFSPYVRGGVVLDYGCFDGEMIPLYEKLGAGRIIGIDISRVAIQRAAERYSKIADFIAADAHKMPVASKSFDVVIGRAILHHLDLPIALKEIHRVLKPSGKAFFVEPLGDNPAARLVRALTPKARTVDEKPLSRSDLAFADAIFGNGDHIYSSLLSTPVGMATSLTRLGPDNSLLKLMDKVDLAFATTPMRTWMQTVYCCWTKAG